MGEPVCQGSIRTAIPCVPSVSKIEGILTKALGKPEVISNCLLWLSMHNGLFNSAV